MGLERATHDAQVSGVVPQQPPMIRAPASKATQAYCAINSGVPLNRMAPSTNCGMPQFALATRIAAGSDAEARLTMDAMSSEGPVPQLLPHAARWMLTMQCGQIERRNAHHRPPVGIEAQVATTGKPVARAPAIAASVSSTDDMVSIHRISAPPRSRATACSANASWAAATLKGPRGSRISPVGPMLPATSTTRPARSASWRAIGRRPLVQLPDTRLGLVELQAVARPAEGIGQDDVRTRHR